MKCVLLAAGSMQGQSKTYGWPEDSKPKNLYHVKGEVLLERQVRIIRKALKTIQKVKPQDIRLVFGYKKKLVERFVKKKKLKITLIYCPESATDIKNWHHGMDSVRAGLKGIDEDVIIMLGDTYTTRSNLLKMINHPNKLVASYNLVGYQMFKISRKYLPKLRAFTGGRPGQSIYDFIMREKKVPNYKRPCKLYMNHCLIVNSAKNFDVDYYRQTDEFKS